MSKYTMEQQEVIEQCVAVIYEMSRYVSLCETLGLEYSEEEEERLERVFKELMS